MAVIRCPSCGKPNPDFLETCQYCDASLRGPATPPQEGAPENAQPSAPAPSEPEGDIFDKLRSTPAFSGEEAEAQPSAEVPDWLKRLGGADDASQAAPTQSAKPADDQAGKVASWLESLRSEEPEEKADSRDWYWTGAQAPAETPAAPPPAPSPGGELPDWLRSLDTETPPQAAPPAESETPGLPDWLEGVSAGTAAQPLPVQPAASPPAAAPEPAKEVPDWLQEFTAPPPVPPQPASPAAAAPVEALPDWLQEFQAVTPTPAAPSQPIAASLPEVTPAEELPDWLQGAGVSAVQQPEAELPAASSAAEPPLAAEPPVAAAPAVGDELPGWLRAMGSAPPAEEGAPALGQAPDWLESFDAAVPEQPPLAPLVAPAPPQAAPAPEEELPDWLHALGTGPVPAPAPPAEEQPEWLRELGITPAPPEAVAPAAAVTEEQPEWLSALGVTPPQQGEPSGAAAPSAGAEQPEWLRGLDQAATIPIAKPPPVAPFGTGEATLPEAPSDKLPDWLASMAPAKPPVPQATSQPPAISGIHLAPVALPSWLEAMRPTELQRPTIAPEVDDYEETVGVLAGLRGVLRPQTDAIQPGKSATKVHKLELTDAQTKQAGLLARTLAEASQARPASKRSFWQTLPVARLVVFATLFLAFVVPMTFPAAKGFFAPAQRWNPAAQAAFDRVDSLSPAQPALIAFDYDPAQAGELDPLAQAIIAHLQRRGVPIVGISTSPAGAATGEALLNRAFAPTAYGSQYVNLGYLPGGPVGMLQITNGLQPLFAVDYRGTPALWETAVLKQARQLSDFGVIVLVSATPDTVRAWLEQLQSYSARPAVIAAMSAGAEPLVRPYWNPDPAKAQLKGLVSGILGAAQYEQQSGVVGLASGTMWDTLGWGLLVIIVLLIGGNLFYGLAGLLRRQKR